jgi:hypothetical protein
MLAALLFLYGHDPDEQGFRGWMGAALRQGSAGVAAVMGVESPASKCGTREPVTGRRG